MTVKKAGRYELLEELGRGAMGVVHKAFDPMIGRVVAVKTMQLSLAGSGMTRPELLQRFQTEARAAGQLVHPNIIVIYDAGEDEGVFYITMEYVDGRSLQGMMEKKQPFPLPRVMRIMGQVCAALEYAHQRSVVHRDVKPANIMVAADDTVKITDFGTAKIMAMSTTTTGTIVGTPSYMSPEQVKGKPVDGRADIFALGVILYELTTGERPFPGESVTGVIYKIVNEEPISPRDIDSSVHPGLCQVISRALAKEPDLRYQTCRELMQDLLNYRSLGGNVPAQFEGTVVMVGRPGSSGQFQQPMTGTLAGLPDYGALPPPEMPPPRPEPAVVRADPRASASGSRPAMQVPQSPDETPTRSIPRPMTLPPLPVPQRTTIEEESYDTAVYGGRSYKWLLIFILLLVLGGAGYFMWPDLKATFFPPQQTQQALETKTAGPAAVQPPPSAPAAGEAQPEAKVAEPSPRKAELEPNKAAEPESKKSAEAPPAKPDRAALKSLIEDRLARAGYGDRVKVEVRGNVIRLSGSLTPREARALRSRVRVPPGITVDYALTEPQPAAGDEAAPLVESKPKTAPGMGEIEVLTDVNGATVVLTGPQGAWAGECKTPCRFEDLKPGRYAIEVTKEGYRIERRILNVRAGNVSTNEISLQASVARLQISSTPAGADIFVDGRATGQKTPATLMLAPGARQVRVAKQGYEPFEQDVKLVENQLAVMKVPPLEEQKQPRGPGWVEVRTVPRGADILIDNTNTGRKTPDRLELPAGEYTLTLYLKGYQVVRERIVVAAGQTAQLNRTLPPQQ
jgi:serine/threonine protein kinase